MTEFTSLDAEMGYIDGAEDLRTTLETVVAETLRYARDRLAVHGNALADGLPVATVPFPRIPFTTCEEWLGRPGAERDLGTEDEKIIGARVGKELGAPFYYIIDFPTAVKAQTFYAQRKDENPELTGYFDLEYQGLEIASGGPREHRIERLRENLVSAGFDPVNFEGYLEAFRFGMPPHGGWGFGVDRFVWALAGLSNIREARLFPRDRYRLDP